MYAKPLFSDRNAYANPCAVGHIEKTEPEGEKTGII